MSTHSGKTVFASLIKDVLALTNHDRHPNLRFEA